MTFLHLARWRVSAGKWTAGRYATSDSPANICEYIVDVWRLWALQHEYWNESHNMLYISSCARVSGWQSVEVKLYWCLWDTITATIVDIVILVVTKNIILLSTLHGKEEQHHKSLLLHFTMTKIIIICLSVIFLSLLFICMAASFVHSIGRWHSALFTTFTWQTMVYL